ncbi:unnamed protein product [marine sediment metagenome]|uniref:Uncharacterized protein n=1 Tax=marine sediment metagenome TaxID=412755 RepID=X1RRX8_9ZZZZ
MPDLTSMIEEKWYRKAIAGFKEVWGPAVKSAASLDAFCEGISAVTGIPAGTVRSSLPAKNWAAFQADADKYLAIAVAKIEAAHKANKWSSHYKRAFGG